MLSSTRDSRFKTLVKMAVVALLVVNVTACTSSTDSVATHTSNIESAKSPLATMSVDSATSNASKASHTPKQSGYAKQVGVYPIEAFLFSDAEDALYSAAVDRLMSKCMAQYGLKFVPNVAPKKYFGDSRRYGITDAALASTYGYRVSGDYLPSSTPTEGSDASTDADYALAATGNQSQEIGGPLLTSIPAGTVNGVPIYPGGCIGHSRFQLAGSDTAPGHADIAVQIDHESFYNAESSSVVQTVLGRWSACMAAAGLKYRDPLAASDAFSSALITDAEIRTAKEDISCKVKTKLIQIWEKQEIGLQTAAIASKREELAVVRDQVNDELARAESVLGAP